MKNFNKKMLLALSIIMMSFISCTTNSDASKGVPDWVMNIPESTPKYEYFTASGSGKDIDEAKNKANNNLLKEISKMLGSSIKTNTTATAVGDIDNLTQFIEQEIQQNSEANIKGLKIKKSYIEIHKDKNIVYILGEYDKSELKKEQNRLLSLQKERSLTVSKYAEEAKKYYSEKKYYKAALSYTNAAYMAIKLRVDNANVKFTANMQNAKDSLAKLKLTQIEAPKKDIEDLFPPLESQEGRMLSPFYLEAFETEVPLKVAYTLKQLNKNQKVLSEKLTTNEKGIARFILNLSNEPCSGIINFSLDMSEFILIFDTVNNKEIEKEKNSLIEKGLQKKLPLKYKIDVDTSKASTKNIEPSKNKLIGIYIEQYDKNKNLIENSEIENSLIKLLKKKAIM